MLVAFVSALLLGFAVAMPVGPASLLCMQRTLTLGRAAGLATGAGIAAADGLSAALVIGGFGLAADSLHTYAQWLNLGAGALLIALGLRILWVPTTIPAGRLPRAGQRWNSASGFLLTMVNPSALLLMAAALALFGFLEPAIRLPRAAVLVAGICTGSLFWWTALVTAVALAKRQIPPAMAKWLNRAAGLVLIALGFAALGRGFI